MQRANLNAWGNAFLAVAKLQELLEQASRKLTPHDDWSWQYPHRDLVNSAWEKVQCPAGMRMQVAHELEISANTSIREIMSMKGEKWT